MRVIQGHQCYAMTHFWPNNTDCIQDFHSCGSGLSINPVAIGAKVTKLSLPVDLLRRLIHNNNLIEWETMISLTWYTAREKTLLRMNSCKRLKRERSIQWLKRGQRQQVNPTKKSAREESSDERNEIHRKWGRWIQDWRKISDWPVCYLRYKNNDDYLGQSLRWYQASTIFHSRSGTSRERKGNFSIHSSGYLLSILWSSFDRTNVIDMFMFFQDVLIPNTN